MDRTEIRMRCLEAAQLATKTPQSVTTNPDVIVKWATAFEAFVVGPEAAPAPTVRVAKAKTTPTSEAA
jgi:hypothetical protein